MAHTFRIVADTVDPYLSGRIRRGELKPSTAAEHRYILADVATVCGDRPLGRLGPADAERIVEAWHTVAASTRRVRIAVLRQWHRWAVTHAGVSPRMLDTIRSPSLPRRPPRGLSPEQVRRLIRHAPDLRTRTAIVLAVQLGLRAVELVRLDVADIDFDRKLVRVRGKADHERVLPLPAEAEQAVVELLGDRGLRPGPLLQRYDTGGRLKAATIGRHLVATLDAAGLKTGAYDGIAGHVLRHTCAHHLIEHGADVLDVAAVLGHANVATTMTYLPATAHGLRDVLEGRSYLPTG